MKKIKLPDLKKICKNNDIHDYSKLKKDEIIKKIEKYIIYNDSIRPNKDQIKTYLDTIRDIYLKYYSN